MKSSKVLFLVIGVVLAIAVSFILFASPTMIGVVMHGNVHSSGIKQGYLYSLSDKQDSSIGGFSKIYKAEIASLGYGDGLHAGKEGQIAAGGNWAVVWLGDESGERAYDWIKKNTFPSSHFRIEYDELNVKLYGSSKYRAGRIMVVVDPARELSWKTFEIKIPEEK